MPGFIKDINGAKRMRFTKPGTDPNNLNLPAADVIFDSQDQATLSIMYAGEWTSPTWSGNTNTVVWDGYFTTWPALNFSPMVTCSYRINSWEGNVIEDIVDTINFYEYFPITFQIINSVTGSDFRTNSDNTGIRLFYRRRGGARANSITIRYNVYRLQT